MRTALHILTAAILLTGLFSCSDGTKSPGGRIGQLDNPLQTTAVLGHAIHSAIEASDVAGTYTGVLPCADCPGIEMKLTLNTDNSYILSTLYQGSEDGKGRENKGRWKLEGDQLQLEHAEDIPGRYQVDGNNLLVLDTEGNRIKGALEEHYILKKLK